MRTFGNIPEQFARYEDSKIVILPVPYDGTSTWGKGADRGPAAFLNAADNMELYDIETGTEVYKQGIHLLDPITVQTSPEEMCDAVYEAVKHQLNARKFVTMIGGEHSVSIGSIKAFSEQFDNLTVLQFDAHADLRPSYEGLACNHACAVHWASQNCNLIQVGIRSMDISEKEFMDNDKTFFAHRICLGQNEWMEEVIKLCTGNVYITIDLDVFDPAFLPSTGTPEPGGMRWYQVLQLCQMVMNKKTMVGFDIVELCPNEHNKSSDFLMAKLFYKLLSYNFH